MKILKQDTESKLYLPEHRVAVIQSSLRCFVYGVIGLVPLIGIPFAMATIVQSRHLRKTKRQDWNPAERYLTAARGLGPLGFLTSTVFLCLVGLIVPALWRELGSCSSGST